MADDSRNLITSETKHLSSVLEMSESGLFIHTRSVELFIPWGEIRAVRSFKFGCGHLGIDLVNLDRVLATANLTTRLHILFSLPGNSLVRCFGVGVGQINIPQWEFPVSASAVVDMIESRVRPMKLGIETNKDG